MSPRAARGHTLNILVPLAAALMLAACTNSGAPTIGGGPVATASATADGPAGYNPLTDTPDPTAGARQIIENPTVSEVLTPGPDLPEMSLGRADAPVTIIKYMSLTCPHCRAFHRDVFPQLKREYIDTGKVRFVLREFPIGKSSGTATIALRCAPPDKYFTLYAKYLEQQTSWVAQEVRLDAIFAVAQQVGVTRAQFDQCLQNQPMIDGLKRVKDRGRTLGIIGTPNFFIQSKRIKSTLTMAEIRKEVDPLLGGPSAATANAAPAR
ncbi:MAG: disulfide bond formation protein DsbD [Hyphomicrobium sp. 32-62-53]|nr:MAG: disulfide bond formation protein DsbD [Hyphomicrobium sp. 12-62-95]OYX99359.1 MAG: disulfide bond formation protein DsbD [Hyphomicrobium sp. 32-62-53]